MSVDWTINLSHVITVLGLVAGAIGIIYANRADISVIKVELNGIKEDLKAVAGALIQIAKQEERLNSHEKRITKLEDKG